ncbi:MAG TPA: histidine phosphatase family protein [Acidobacteriota bacterium]|nr:histidine phosphatase family protein [Acidobacteriota bacterium]
MQIVLVRHGATDWNLERRCQGSSDRDLSAVGIRQADEIAALLSSENVSAIYASDLKRARRTAEAIGRRHNLPVLTEARIRELDHGHLEGLTFNEIKKDFGEFLTRWRTEPAELQVPGGERFVDVAERAWSALQQIVERHTGADNIVVVSHNFPIVGIVCRITGTHLNHYRDFHLDPCGISRLQCNGDRRWQVTHVNGQEYSARADHLEAQPR